MKFTINQMNYDQIIDKRNISKAKWIVTGPNKKCIQRMDRAAKKKKRELLTTSKIEFIEIMRFFFLHHLRVPFYIAFDWNLRLFTLHCYRYCVANISGLLCSHVLFGICNNKKKKWTYSNHHQPVKGLEEKKKYIL